MTKLIWNPLDEKTYSFGVDHGIISKKGTTVVLPWNGLKNVVFNEVEANDLSIVFEGNTLAELNLGGIASFEVEAFYEQPILSALLGDTPITDGVYLTRQSQSIFNFSYRVFNGPTDYQIHLVYNAIATKNSSNKKTRGKDPNIFSCTITTIPELIEPNVYSSVVTLDSTLIDPEALLAFEDILYGDDIHYARFPAFNEINTIISG